jgi:hypothetical protein
MFMIHPENRIDRNRVHAIPKPAGPDLEPGDSWRAGLLPRRAIAYIFDAEQEMIGNDTII